MLVAFFLSLPKVKVWGGGQQWSQSLVINKNMSQFKGQIGVKVLLEFSNF